MLGVAGLVLGIVLPGGAGSAPPALPSDAAAIGVPAAVAQLPREPRRVVTPLWLLRPRRLDYLSLAALLPVGPTWQNLEANSEQRQPLQLGASLRDQVLHHQAVPRPRLPLPLKALAESQLLRLRQRLGVATAEFEAWPTQNDVGRLTWVVSRWRPRGDAPWSWLSAPPSTGSEPADANLLAEPELILPELLEPAKASDLTLLVDDFLLAPSLYTKPRFSECVWTSGGGRLGLLAFAPSRELVAQRRLLRAASVAQLQSLHCQALPQPPRFHEHALTFVLRVTANGTLLWPDTIDWLRTPEAVDAEPSHDAVVLPQFPPRFVADYRADVQALAGAVALPGMRQPVWLRRKNSADPQHQLGTLLRFLAARYQKLGLTLRHQRFFWRGVAQENLVAVLRGTRVTGNRPVLLADHIDTALSEDVFQNTGQRVSAPGADDNAAAVAALLRAAEVLRPLPRQHDIWLVHLTGEEFPADDLGARRFVSELLGQRVDIAAVLLLDMIGHPPATEPSRRRPFQLNPGGLFESGVASLRLAQLARRLTPQVAPALQPLLLPVTDLRNYLYNTDGLIFAEAGFPVLLLNEVMNRYHLARSGYHDSSDTVEKLDFDYAADITRVAITTAAVLAQQGGP